MKFLYCGFVLLVLAPFFNLQGQDSTLILKPEMVLKKTDAVIVLSEMEVFVKTESSLKVSVHKIVKILNQKGEGAGTFGLHYDKFVIPSDIRIQIFDVSGNLIKTVKEKEIQDYSQYDGFSMFTDNRMKYYRPVVGKYPYTVEYSYELNFRGYVALPRWSPVPDYNIEVKQSSFSVEFDTLLNIRYKLVNFDQQPAIGTKNATRQLRWDLKDTGPFEDEPFSPEIFTRVPSVLLACNKFEYDGSKGDLTSWNSFGSWISSLLQGRQELTEVTRQKVNSLVSGLSDDQEKARVLYEFLQEQMRYVSIQLGIGGFRPFDASDVDKWGYGDCKALSNYYLALLKVAGINGIYTVTVSDGGTPMFYNDFPANLYFNHVIVCLPFEKDTAWVECTSNYFPFGFMSRNVAGNPALLVTPEGGKLVTVPSIPAIENNEFRRVEVNVDDEGSADLEITITYKGLQLSHGISNFVMSHEEQEKSLYEDFEMNDFVISKHAYSFKKAGNASVVLTALVLCNHLATISGNRLFIPFRILDSPMKIPEKVENRITPVELQSSYFDCDTVLIRIPEGFSIESLPKEYSLEPEFGKYHLQIVPAEKQVTIIKSLLIEKNQFPPEKYEAFREFLIAINKAEKQKLILKKAE